MKKVLRYFESKKINYFLLLINVVLFIFFLFKVSFDLNLTKFLLVLFVFAIVPGNLINTYLIKVNFSGLTKFFVQYLFGISFWIIFLFANTLIFKIKLNNYVLISIVVGEILFLVLKNFRRLKIPTISLESNIIIFIFNCSFFTFFSHTYGLLTAPLHDTVVNSYLGSFFIKSGFSTFPANFISYPPGGGLLTGLLSCVSGVIPTQVVLYLTVFSICITGLSMGLFIGNIFKSKYLGAFMGIIPNYLLPLQAYEYFNGSKNSHIFMTPLFFISAVILAKFFNEKGDRFPLRDTFMISVLFVSLTLLHFNYLLLSIPFFIFIFLKNIKNKKFWKKIIVFGLFLLVFFIPYFLLISKGNSSDSKLSIQPTALISIQHVSLLDLKLFITMLLSTVKAEMKFIIVLGVIVSTICFLKKKYTIYLIPIIYLVVYYLFSKSGHPLISAYASYDYYILILFAALAFFAVLYSESKTIFFAVLCWTLLLSIYNYHILRFQYNDMRKYSMLTKYDLQAFDWINGNIQDNGLFFSPYFSPVPDEQRVYDLSPILYLSTFSEKASCPAFTDVKRGNCTKEFVSLLNKGQQNNIKDIELLLKRNNVRYIYLSLYRPWGQGAFINSTNKVLLENNEVIYKNFGVSILKLNID